MTSATRLSAKLGVDPMKMASARVQNKIVKYRSMLVMSLDCPRVRFQDSGEGENEHQRQKSLTFLKGTA